jgi:integrase
MPSKSLTCKIDQRSIDKYVKEQRLLGDRLTLSDETCGGLKLVINSRSCSWTYSYRKRGYLNGSKRHPQHTMKLGDPVSMSPAEARLAAETIKSQVRAGDDPAFATRAKERERKAEEARKRTCAQWLGMYRTEQMQSGQTKYQRDELRNVRLSLNELSLIEAYPDEITPKHIRDLADIHHARNATGRHRLGAMSRFLDYLLDEEVIAANPVASVSKRRKPKPAPPRENYFTPEQLGALWNAEGLKPSYQRYLRFMITSPLRAGEVAELTWKQVNNERAELLFWHDDTKNSEHFVMPLSSIAKQVIWEAEQVQGELVFPLSSIENAQMSSWSYFNKCVRKASLVEDFILHDLRRTFSTLMAEHSDVSESLIDSLLNHKQSATRGGVIRHYQQSKNLEKRRDVMAQWGKLLEAWVETTLVTDE